jgi:hypothetical protein
MCAVGAVCSQIVLGAFLAAVSTTENVLDPVCDQSVTRYQQCAPASEHVRT